MRSDPRPASHHVIMRFLPMLVWMAVIFTMSAQSTVPTVPGFTASLTAIAGHFTVYAMLAALLWWALGAFRLPAWQRIALAFAVPVLYGLTDEFHQSFVPGRTPDPFDIMVDASGAAVALVIIHLLVRSRLLPR